MNDTPVRLTVYTDGATKKNPGPCGWSWFCVETGEQGAGKFSEGTNNVAELTAVLMALGAQPDGSEVTIVTDSQNVIDYLSKAWNLKGSPNLAELRRSIFTLRANKNIKLFLRKVKGHQKGPTADIYNQKVDRLASAQAELARYLPTSEDEILQVHLTIKGMDIFAVPVILDAIERAGGDVDGMAHLFDKDMNVMAQAQLRGRQIEVQTKTGAA